MESPNFNILEEKVKLVTEKLATLSEERVAYVIGATDAAPARAPKENGGMPAKTVGRVRDKVQGLLHILAEL